MKTQRLLLLEVGPAQMAREVQAQLGKVKSPRQRQHMAAFDACITLASAAEHIKDAEVHVQHAAVVAASWNRERGRGGDVTSFVSHLREALRRGHELCFLRPALQDAHLQHVFAVLEQQHCCWAHSPLDANIPAPSFPCNGVPPTLPTVPGAGAGAGSVGLVSRAVLYGGAALLLAGVLGLGLAWASGAHSVRRPPG